MDELRVIASTEHREVVQVWDCPKVANATRGIWRPGFAFTVYSSTPRFQPNDPRGEFAKSIKSAGEPFPAIIRFMTRLTTSSVREGPA
jgi:hypothetical protein